MFGFIKRIFIGLLSVSTAGSFREWLVFNSKGPLKCKSLNNEPSKARSALVNIYSDETLLYPFTFTVNEGGGSCNTIEDPGARICIPNKVKLLM